MTVLPQFDCHRISLTAAATLGAYTRVKLTTSGTVDVAGVTDTSIGYLTERGSVSGALCTVQLHGLPFNAIAAGAIEVGDICWSAASGKVNDVDAGSGKIVGIAYTAAAADTNLLTLFRPDYVA